jgi:hypothetical protein
MNSLKIHVRFYADSKICCPIQKGRVNDSEGEKMSKTNNLTGACSGDVSQAFLVSRCSVAFAGKLLVLALSAWMLLSCRRVVAGDYSPTSPVRPSPGLINEWLRKEDPYKAAWDIGVNVRVREEVKKDGGVAPATDFREKGVDNDNSYLLMRVRPRVGYTAEWFSVLAEARHSRSVDDDRAFHPEDDPLDLHQAYVTLGNHKEFPLSLKVGRQELSYGDERLIGAFAWNNIGRVFDAAKLRWQNPYFAADVFSGRVIIANKHEFNTPNDYDWFSGIYATTKRIPKQTTDFYVLARNTSDKSPRVNGIGQPAILNGPPPRDIYTVGMRMKSSPGELGNWDYTAEFMGQLGHFSDPALPATLDRSLEHQAYAIFAGAGYTWSESVYAPRLGLEYNYASGDGDPRDGKHETFENLFPTNHKFYGYMDFVSLQNIHNIRLTSSIKPLPRLNLAAEYHAFWLADTSDNLYAVNGARRGGIGATPGTGYGINPSYDSYVGSEIDFVATYNVSPTTIFELGYGHFFVGDYVKQSLSAPTAGSKDANYIYFQAVFNF